MKQCSKCGEWKEEGMFEKKRNRCKACKAARSKEYYANNREKVAAQKKEWYANNQEKVVARSKEYYANNREKVAARGKEYYANNWEKKAAQMKEYRANLKAQAYAVLGGAFCVRCGYTGTALQIDHVNSDGFLDRKKTNTGDPLYKKIIATGGAGYQVLCARCNWEKRDEDNERREAMRQALKWEDVFGVQKVTAVLDVV